MASIVARRASRLRRHLAVLAIVALVACGDDQSERVTTHTTPTAPTAPLAATPPTILAPAVTAASLPPLPPSSGCDAALMALTEPDRVTAMLVMQTVVLTWDPDVSHSGLLEVPSNPVVAKALDILRCDTGPRAISRHARGIAKFLGMDWQLARARPYLLRLGFANDQAIDDFKARVVAQIGAPIFAVHAHDPRWVEYIVMRRLATAEPPPGRVAAADPGWFGPPLAHAQSATLCWQPEEPWKFNYGPPWVQVGGHVSVVIDPNAPQSAEQARVQGNIDPQQWDVCGRYWSPPNPVNPSGPPLDGARFVKPNWPLVNGCMKPQETFDRPDQVDEPGTRYDARYLFEHFFVPPGPYSKLGDAFIKNILIVLARGTTETLPNGTSVPAHRIDYALGLCGPPYNVDGAMDGSIYTKPMKTILDAGGIDVWSDGTRIHVRASKTFQLSDPVGNWLTQLNPALRELNEELGELACCL
jgi:hypothetical protein